MVNVCRRSKLRTNCKHYTTILIKQNKSVATAINDTACFEKNDRKKIQNLIYEYLKQKFDATCNYHVSVKYLLNENMICYSV